MTREAKIKIPAQLLSWFRDQAIGIDQLEAFLKMPSRCLPVFVVNPSTVPVEVNPDNLVWQHQEDAAISQANPVSDTLYEVLATTENVRIVSLHAKITWATTQPTNLRIVVTIDGQTRTFTVGNPVSATAYMPQLYADRGDAQVMAALTIADQYSTPVSRWLTGRSVKVEVGITWATTQPTPMVCRVKYLKIP